MATATNYLFKKKSSASANQDQFRSSPPAISPQRLAICSNADARRYLKLEVAQRLNVLPLMVTKIPLGVLITFAVGETRALGVLEQELRFATGNEVKLVPVAEDSLTRAIEIAYFGDENRLQDKLEILQETPRGTPKLEPQQSQHTDLHSGNGEASQFLAAMVDYALAKNASDLHFVPRRDGCYVRIRIDGRLKTSTAAVCTLSRHGQLIRRLKVVASLDTTITETPLDGSFLVGSGDRSVNVRIGLMPTIHGERAVLRFLGSGTVRSLEELNLAPEVLRFLEFAKQSGEGAILLVGATGSGKTTTLYALMRKFIDQDSNVVSIEDPVEIELVGASQTSLKAERGMDYATCLKALLRHDPDVIMVGEMRDPESASIALQASITGHLLLSTLHARDVFEAFLRLNFLGVDWLTTAQALRLIVAQRLLATLCPKCQVIDLTGSNESGFDVFRPVGCAACDYSGYQDRAVVAEALKIDPSIESALLAGQFQRGQLKTLLTDQNYVPVKPQLDELLRQGRISLEQYRGNLV